MLKYNIKNLMRLRGISQPSAFLKKYGFTQNVATRIAAEKMVAISPWQVERLCTALKCLPSDLYCWTADKGETANEIHPLWKIREHAVMSVTEVGKGIPAEKMGEFLEKVKEVEEGMKG
jgi:DNA-binding Xre family transcriptional regulator